MEEKEKNKKNAPPKSAAGDFKGPYRKRSSLLNVTNSTTFMANKLKKSSILAVHDLHG